MPARANRLPVRILKVIHILLTCSAGIFHYIGCPLITAFNEKNSRHHQTGSRLLRRFTHRLYYPYGTGDLVRALHPAQPAPAAIRHHLLLVCHFHYNTLHLNDLSSNARMVQSIPSRWSYSCWINSERSSSITRSPGCHCSSR